MLIHVRVVIVVLMAIGTAGTLEAQITSNPIPAPIVKRGIFVEVKDLVRLPDTRSIRPADEDVILGTAGYGERFVCAVARPPLYGVQFHPEKSSSSGLRLLENFAGICASVGSPA